ncbi:MAG: pectate lyase [Bacteroidales bacterium]|nr:pectate lyase [Bacteroidales bacterium]
MKNYVFIGKRKKRFGCVSINLKHKKMFNTSFPCSVMYLFFIGWVTILGACTDIKGFTNTELGPYVKDPEVLKAFPTAEGFGKNATGGRGGIVVKVTNTNDDGEGSFRWALKQCSENEATTVVFTVSGKIELKSDIRCKAKNFTIAGQTAPGGGICIIKNEVNLGGSENFIIRHVRFRVGDKDANGKDHNATCLRVENANNFIIDHCSFSWASEENTDFIDNHFSTVQWCISSEGLYYSVNKKGSRGYGGAWGGSSSTYHHNLFAHCNSRTPLMNGARGKDPGQDINVYMEYINNVNYNWGSQMATYGGMDESQDLEYHGWSCNFVNNYYKPGPATIARVKDQKFFRQSSARDPERAPLRDVSKWYFSGNVMEGNSPLTSDNWKGIYTDANYPYSLDEMKSPSFIIPSGKDTYEQYRFDWETYTLFEKYESAEKAFQSVIGENGAGAFPRDKVDLRIIKDVKDGICTYTGAGDDKSGSIPGIINSQEEAEGFEGLTYNTSGAIIDVDGDGMDDVWEKKVGLDPTNPEDRNRTTEAGYTALEVYLNSLVGESISYNFKK